MHILLFFLISSYSWAFDDAFVFGVANAPAQVEDDLNDIWVDWGRAGHIKTWKQTIAPEKRIEFWSKPEVEIALAEKLGVQSFRLGVEWARVMPGPGKFDEKAIAHYREIFRLIKSKNIKIMLTLFHHSVPRWIQEQKGWHEDSTKKNFLEFAQRMVTEFNNDVEWWTTFNEANIFVINAYTQGIWPPGETGKISSVFALDRMADAHNELYDWSHARFPKIKMGVAHNMARYKGDGLFNSIGAKFADYIMNWRFPEKIRGKMDFFGFNYYGAEWISGAGLEFNKNSEYTESGRAIDVRGLYDLLKEIHQRFSDLSIIITENGIADTNDEIRGAYLSEHLAAVQAAVNEKIPVSGYYVWSLTDNLEWSDGYCPKFGLVAVDRSTMTRHLRRSFDVYQEIIRQKKVPEELRKHEWTRVLKLQGKKRLFCRDTDGVTALDVPVNRAYSKIDWRLSADLEKLNQ